MKQIVLKANLPRVLSISAAFILVLLPFHAVITTWAGATWGHLDAFRIWKELLIIPLTIGAYMVATRDEKLKKWLQNDVLIFLILLYIITHVILGLSALTRGVVTRNALIYSMLINTRFLIFFAVCLVFSAKDNFLSKHWRKLLLVPAGVVIFFGLLQLWVLPANILSHVGYGPKTIPAYQTVDQKPDYVRLQSTLRGPNPLGAYLLLIITTLGAFVLVAKKQSMRLLLIVGLSSIALLFTYSRSAWLGTILSVVLLGYWVFPKGPLRRYTAIGFVLLMVIAGGFVVAYRNNNLVQNTLFHSDETSQSPVSSNAARASALESGARSLISEPFGRGPGTAGPASFRNYKPARIAENYFIQIGQEVGLVGLVLFVAINVVVASRLWARRDNQLASILLATLVGITLVNMLSHAWADDTLSLLWWGLAGVAVAPVILKNKGYVKN